METGSEEIRQPLARQRHHKVVALSPDSLDDFTRMCTILSAALIRQRPPRQVTGTRCQSYALGGKAVTTPTDCTNTSLEPSPCAGPGRSDFCTLCFSLQHLHLTRHNLATSKFSLPRAAPPNGKHSPRCGCIETPPPADDLKAREIVPKVRKVFLCNTSL
jgi:hypothetical protein